MAYQGKYKDAENYFIKNNKIESAIDMYTELNMWEDAKRLASLKLKNQTSETGMKQESKNIMNELLLKKAQVEEDKRDLQQAANTYIEVGDYNQAINIIQENSMLDKLIELARSVPKTETIILYRCIENFRTNKRMDYMEEILKKIGDSLPLIEFYAEENRWEEAFKLSEMFPDITKRIYLPLSRLEGWI
jgi:intraflagellar transport protein 122